jgi:hypothetical protein
MCRTLLACVGVAGLLLNQRSLAQEFKAAPPHLRGESGEGLLLRETVQRDLGLTVEQKQAVDKILRAENPIRMNDLYERLAAYSKKALTTSQQERLQEIYVQAHGAEALFNPAIKTELRLSDDQKDKLNDVRMPYMAATAAWRKSLKEIPREDREKRKAAGKRRQIMMKEFDDTAMSILTAEQLDQFKKMRGKPIDLSGEREGLPRRSSK